MTVLESPIWRKVERPKLNARTARLMTALCGVKVTETNVKDAKRRGAGPDDLVGSIASFTDDDRRFLTAWFRLFPVAPEVLDIAEMLCEQGSAASAELDDLFLDATAFDTSCGDPDDPDMVHYDPFDDDPGDTQTTSKWFLGSTPTLYEDGLEEGLEDGSEANFGTLEQTPPEALERVRVVVRENEINHPNFAKSDAEACVDMDFSNKRHPAIKSTD